MILLYALSIYAWLSLASFFLIKILFHEHKFTAVEYVVFSIVTPVAMVDILISKIRSLDGGTDMNNIKHKLRRTISRCMDRATIRFINILDRMNGTYEK